MREADVDTHEKPTMLSTGPVGIAIVMKSSLDVNADPSDPALARVPVANPVTNPVANPVTNPLGVAVGVAVAAQVEIGVAKVAAKVTTVGMTTEIESDPYTFVKDMHDRLRYRFPFCVFVCTYVRPKVGRAFSPITTGSNACIVGWRVSIGHGR